jgi:hypothetical protein
LTHYGFFNFVRQGANPVRDLIEEVIKPEPFYEDKAPEGEKLGSLFKDMISGSLFLFFS